MAVDSPWLGLLQRKRQHPMSAHLVHNCDAHRFRKAMEGDVMGCITFDAPAKVNLCLAVKYPPVDGYHLLDSVFCELALHDTVHVEIVGIDDCVDARGCACTQAGTSVALDCGLIDVPTEDNLVFKAVDAFEQAFGEPVVDFDQGLRVVVEKRIPAGGGLGGGSSDAASTLKTLCQLVGMSPDDPVVVEVAKRLGADVAFFLHGGVALMDGRGDCLVRKLAGFPLPVVLMGENQGISTPKIYRDFDAKPALAPDALALARLLDEFPAWGASYEQKRELALLCANNLEQAAFAACPRLEERVSCAKQDPDVLNALVTGSGATSFAICADEGAAMRFEKRASAYCDWTCIC